MIDAAVGFVVMALAIYGAVSLTQDLRGFLRARRRAGR